MRMRFVVFKEVYMHIKNGMIFMHTEMHVHVPAPIVQTFRWPWALPSGVSYKNEGKYLYHLWDRLPYRRRARWRNYCGFGIYMYAIVAVYFAYFESFITQYGSTVYIGIAMVYPHWKPYIRFFITFSFSLLPTELLLTWICGYTWKLNVIIKWHNLIDDKGVKLTKEHFVNSPSSASSSSSSSSSSSAWTSVTHKR